MNIGHGRALLRTFYHRSLSTVANKYTSIYGNEKTLSPHSNTPALQRQLFAVSAREGYLWQNVFSRFVTCYDDLSKIPVWLIDRIKILMVSEDFKCANAQNSHWIFLCLGDSNLNHTVFPIKFFFCLKASLPLGIAGEYRKVILSIFSLFRWSICFELVGKKMTLDSNV